MCIRDRTVAIGSTCLSGFFFPQQSRKFLGRFPFSVLEQALRVSIQNPQEGAPRGLQNIGNNCFLNTLVHYLDADPAVGEWLRTPLVDLEAFINFMNDYPQPPNLIVEFREYYQRQVAASQQHQQQGTQGNIISMPPPVSLFKDFLEQYPINQDCCLLYTSPSPRDRTRSRMPSSA